MTKAWSGAPFGKQSTRFSINGLHPNMLVSGYIPYESSTSTLINGKQLGPGMYDLLQYNDFSDKNLIRKADGPNWEQALHTEKEAKIPHSLYKEAYNRKKEFEKRLGPGSYHIDGNLEHLDKKPVSNRGFLDALSTRFPNNSKALSVPGPGAYGVPDTFIEEKRKNKVGNVPSFERSKEPRSLPNVGCEVPPGTYNHKSTIDELINKKVSKLGPYQLYSLSLNRSDAPVSGHFTNNCDWNVGPGHYNIKSFTDEFITEARKKQGKFGKLHQYPEQSGERISVYHTSLVPKNKEFPGPFEYSPNDSGLAKFKTNLPPFNASTIRMDKRANQNFMRNYNSVGVGRYDVQRLEESEFKNGHTSIFKSKTKQITDRKQDVFIQERLKPHNLSHEQKKNLYTTGNVHRLTTA